MRRLPGLRHVLLVAALLLAPTAFAQTTFTVTRTDDPPPNGCQAGDCSLREAILAANALSGPDGVALAAATYSVASTIEITSDLIVIGVDAAQTHIVATAPLSPLLQIFEGAPVRLTLRDLSIDAAGGEEVLGVASANLVLEYVRAPNPDGFFDLDYGGGGIINATGSVIAGTFSCYGCSVAYVQLSEIGDLSFLQTDIGGPTQIQMIDVVIDGNDDPGSSVRLSTTGALWMFGVTVRNTRFGVRVESAPAGMIVERLRYLDNREPFEISGGADFTISRSEFRDNTPTSSGQPAALWIHNSGAHVIVEDSTFAGNTGTSNTGGAVLVESGAELSVRNSTFVGNGFSTAAAAAGARGAAIGYRGDASETVLTLQNVTIVAPLVAPVGTEGTALGGRGATSDVRLNLYNSIFVGSCRLDFTVPNFAIGNVKTSGDSCGLGSGNLTGVSRADVALGTLGDHGGATSTVIPGTASVAIDAGSNLGCLGTDQRGAPRPSGLRCDAGAIETGDVIFANGFN